MTQQVRRLGGAGVVLAFAWAAVQAVKRAALLPLDRAKVKGGKKPGKMVADREERGCGGWERCQAQISA